MSKNAIHHFIWKINFIRNANYFNKRWWFAIDVCDLKPTKICASTVLFFFHVPRTTSKLKQHCLKPSFYKTKALRHTLWTSWQFYLTVWRTNETGPFSRCVLEPAHGTRVAGLGSLIGLVSCHTGAPAGRVGPRTFAFAEVVGLRYC